MNIREVDIRNARYTENRMRAFKERNWKEQGHPEPVPTFITAILIGICLALILIYSLCLLFL